jgi:polysaccharide biosynthesis transport protein
MNTILTKAKRHWKSLVFLNGAILSLAAAGAVLSPKVWMAEAQLIMPDSSSKLDSNLGTLGSLSQMGVSFTNEMSPLKVQASILTSQDVMQRTLKQDPERETFDNLTTYTKLFKAKPGDQSTIIQLEVKGSSPELAKKRTENLLVAYQQRLNDLRLSANATRQSFVLKQLGGAESNLREARIHLANFQKATGLVNSEEQSKSLVSTMGSLTDSQAQITAQAQAAETQAKSLSQQLGLTPEQATSTLRLSENKEYQELRQKLSTVEAELADVRGTYTDASYQVERLLSRRKELQRALEQVLVVVAPNAPSAARMVGGDNGASVKGNQASLMVQLLQVESQAKGLRQQARQLQENVSTLQNRLNSSATLQGQLSELQRKYEIAEGVYKGIVGQLQQDKVSAFNYYPNIQTLDMPTVELKPISPKPSLIALGVLLATICGSAALIILLDSRDPLFEPKDLQEFELPILGRFPQLPQLAPELNLGMGTEVEFQRLASAISLMPSENRNLMVTSSTAGEGKTTISLGLALALTDLGFHVLLIDADFKRASLSNRLGITESVQNFEPVEVRKNLDLLPASLKEGSRQTIDKIAQGKFKQNLTTQQQSGKYDYIIIDSSPIGLTSEAALVAADVKRVLMVARMTVSLKSQVLDTLTQLNRHNAEVIGVALNGLESSRESYLYQYRSEYSQVSP